MSDVSAWQSRGVGQIVTFYSFKGGTGRTMALANVAWILAANGLRVLIADWDLESPGLHRFFQPFMEPAVSGQPGIVDFIRGYEWTIDENVHLETLDTDDDKSERAAPHAITRLIDEYVREVSDLIVPVSWRFPDEGAIHFLSPGQQDNGVYKNALSALDWDTLYDKLYGAEFLDALRAYLKNTYDYVLIDSRTGLSDIADICTLHLPDMVVDCFTLSNQGIDGAAKVAKQIQRFTGRDIAILPVPMRIDHSREEKVTAGIEFAERQFAGLPVGMPQEERSRYWADVEVPYRAGYAYEETLAAFGDRPGTPDSLLSSYERITARITSNSITRLPPRQEWLRLRTWRKFSRTPSASPPEIVIDFSPQDQLWAEWIAAVLAGAGLAARLVGEQAGDAGTQAQLVAVVSDSYLSRLEDSPTAAEPPAAEPDLLISVTDMSIPPGALGEVPLISLVDLSETEAVERLIDRFDGIRPPERESVTGAMRYPADSSDRIDNLLTRNPHFTGRDAVLRQLREELRSRGEAVVLQSAKLRGLGGVGKTQVALEYAHRFKEDYEVVWWLNCDPPQYIDASLVDLGRRLREVFGASLPEEGGVAELVRQVLQFLSERATQRWLLIYDNAENIEAIQKLLPSGGGHVLITSRNERWEDQSAHSKTLKLGFFERPESISHLRQRQPTIAATDADKLAEELGDMPLAVAAAGALLASENMPVPEYLRKLAAEPVRPLPEEHPLRAYPEAVAKAWHLSLDRLERRSAAAARLLGICSVMAPEISFDLIYSDAMVGVLRDLDSGISEPAMITRLVKQIDLLALIKIEYTARQIVVHRVVQTVVRERMSAAGLQTERLQAARRDAHTLLVTARPKGDVDDPEMWSAYRQIWPHLRPSQAELSAREQVRDLLIDRVRYLRQRDDLEPGGRRAQTIESAWIAMLAEGPDSEVASSLRKQLYRLRFNMANIRRDLGQFERSRALDEAVLLGQREQLGDEHPHTLQTRSSLAADLRALGEYQEALALDLATYDSWVESGFGEDYAGTLFAANNLALSSLVNGDFRDALRRDRLTLKRRISLYGSPRHPRALNSGTAVARDLLEAGRYREAVRMMTEVMTQSHESLGDDARITLNARLWLGIAQRCAGTPEQAAVNIAAAVSGLSRGFGPDSDDALASRLSQALNQLALGEFNNGRTVLEKVLADYDRRLGPTHPNALICRLNFAAALCLEESYAAAQPQVEWAVGGLTDRLGSAHPHTLAANLVRGSVLACLGSPNDAAAVEELVLAERTRVLGPRHPDTLRCRANLLLTLRQLGANGPGTDRQDVIAELAELLGAEHPDVTAAGSNRRLFCLIIPQPF
jgi:MinD-like ATPase involved in chromosome partitioning or flagellar assembly/tetratricopeptide (TPR) repeat protein